MPLIIPVSLHSMQNVVEAEGLTAPSTPTVVKDDMSFPELCETLKVYCKFFVFPCRVLASQPLTRCYTTNTVIENIDTPQNLSTVKLSPVTTRLCSQLTDRGAVTPFFFPKFFVASLYC